MGTNFIRQPPIHFLVIATFWLVSFSVAGQEETASEPAPPPPESVATPPESPVAPAPAQDQMLAGEFELLQQETTIESASKREESVFASPFSADVITRDMIIRSGARTIPEALRLLPGMIVREQSSGNFDVHVRGLDNMPPGAMIHDFLSTTLLVMIDYRVVYNYIMGGTFWEALPIDIVDVERIELVRGPTAALYGPNAVTGVINIITRKPTANGLQASARAEGALTSRDPEWKDDYRVGQRSLSGKFAYKYDSLSGGVSANYHSFDRLSNGLYSYGLPRRVSPENLIIPFTLNLGPYHYIAGTTMNDDAKVRFPEPNLGQRAVGANAFAAYEPTDKLSFVLTGGYQESRAVREFAGLPDLYSPFTTNDSQSWYLDLRSRAYNFTFQASFMSGHQFVPTGKQVLPDGSSHEFYDYTYNTLDLNLDYDYQWEWLRVRPGASFRRAQFSGYPFATWDYSQETNTGSLINKTKALQSASASLALEQTPWKKLRFVEAVRVDFYFDRTADNYYPLGATDVMNPKPKHGQVVYPSFQFAVTYTPVENHLLRVSYARANKSPSMTEMYYNDPRLQINGNKALDLLTLDTVEIGYRNRLTREIDMSLEVFGNYERDFTNSYLHGFDINHMKAIHLFDNYDLKVYQLGATASLDFTTHHFQGRIFATVQQTFIQDFDANIFRSYDLTYNPADPNNKKFNEMHVGTPDVFGGFYLNYQPADKWNINVNAYYFSQHTQIHSDIPTGDVSQPPVSYLTGKFDIQQSFLLNAKVSYDFWKGLAAYVNVRNALNINQAQFIWGDNNHILCFVGLQYEL